MKISESTVLSIFIIFIIIILFMYFLHNSNINENFFVVAAGGDCPGNTNDCVNSCCVRRMIGGKWQDKMVCGTPTECKRNNPTQPRPPPPPPPPPPTNAADAAKDANYEKLLASKTVADRGCNSISQNDCYKYKNPAPPYGNGKLCFYAANEKICRS